MLTQSVTAFTPRRSENIHKHRRESTFRRQLSLIDLDDQSELATVRFYGKGSRNYCCIWLHNGATYASGSGWAGGYGYHKDSAAMQSALQDAGFTFAENFDGVGEGGEVAALDAIARWFDIHAMIVKAHP